MIDWVLYFFIYSFLGWVCESAYCSLLSRRFVNRGFLTGPFCPIYAAGALTILFFARQLPRDAAVLFVFGFFSTSAIEYFTGWLMEALFKAKWWDYSDSRFNIKGRVCLRNSIYFGLLAVALVFFIHPPIVRLIGMMSPTTRFITAAAVFAYVMADLAATVTTVLKLNSRLKKIDGIMGSIKEKLDAYGWYTTSGIRERIEKLKENAEAANPIFKTVESLRKKLKSIESDNHILQRRLIRAFPDVRSLKYPEYLNNIKKQIAGMSRHPFGKNR